MYQKGTNDTLNGALLGRVVGMNEGGDEADVVWFDPFREISTVRRERRWTCFVWIHTTTTTRRAWHVENGLL